MSKNSAEKVRPWYHKGLKFECTQCGNCCTGAPGYVFVTRDEIERIAEFLGRPPGAGLPAKYLRKVGRGYSLTEDKTSGDCCFLKTGRNGRRSCSIYPVRPIQCRTWPFWDTNLESADEWAAAARDCPGMNTGRAYDFVQIEVRRKARTPEDLPS